MDEAVRALSDEVGIAVDWTDAAGAPHRVGIGSLRAILAALGFPCRTPDELAHSRTRAQALATRQRNFITASVDSPLTLELGKQSDVVGEIALDGGKTIPITLRAAGNAHIVPAIAEPGYHRLRVADREITLAVAPARCLTLEQVAAGGKMYGLAVQLYALRRPNDGGIGDTSALSDLVAGAAREGADAIALSPVHSLFASEPGHYGPYSPSSRLFLNPLYADPTVLFGEARVATAREGSGNSTADDVLIDWPVAARTRYTLFRKLFDDFANELKQAPPSPLATDYREFVRDGGARLGEHALFEAAHRHHYRAEKPAWSWRDWPDDWRIPTATGIAKFSDTSAREIDFHMFMQWIATRTFSSVQAAARDAGMRIGLIADLAIGMSPDGSHAWSRQDDLLLGLSIGAPPDPFNTRGQDWGLTAFSPQALMSRGFEPFIATLRAAMRIAGGVRIDHVMGLTRLWLIPRGGSPVDGAYLRYPFEDLLRIVALESHRHGAIVIGEDLGTVPPEFRARAAAAGIAGMDVLVVSTRPAGLHPSRPLAARCGRNDDNPRPSNRRRLVARRRYRNTCRHRSCPRQGGRAQAARQGSRGVVARLSQGEHRGWTDARAGQHRPGRRRRRRLHGAVARRAGAHSRRGHSRTRRTAESARHDRRTSELAAAPAPERGRHADHATGTAAAQGAA